MIWITKLLADWKKGTLYKELSVIFAFHTPICEVNSRYLTLKKMGIPLGKALLSEIIKSPHRISLHQISQKNTPYSILKNNFQDFNQIKFTLGESMVTEVYLICFILVDHALEPPWNREWISNEFPRLRTKNSVKSRGFREKFSEI